MIGVGIVPMMPNDADDLLNLRTMYCLALRRVVFGRKNQMGATSSYRLPAAPRIRAAHVKEVHGENSRAAGQCQV